MKSSHRRIVLLAGLVALGRALAAEVVVTGSAPIVDTRATSTGTSIDAQAFERLPVGRDFSQLLLLAPGVIDNQPVDRVTIGIDGRSLKGFRPFAMPEGWNAEQVAGGYSFSGPSLDGPIAIGGEIEKIEVLRGTGLKAEFGSSVGGVLQVLKLPLRRLDAVKLIDDPAGAIRLPQRISPGDAIEFRPLLPLVTIGGGDWRIGNLQPTWNGSLGEPLYRLDVPAGFGYGIDQPLRISYTDPWGIKLVDGPATDVTIGPPPGGASSPGVTGCSPAVLPGNSFCACGNFPPGAASELLINGRSIGQYLVSSSPTILNFNLPADFPAGPMQLDAGRTSGFDIADGARGVMIHVGGEIDRNKLKRRESTPLKLWLDGTDRSIDLRLWNSTPGVVSLSGGNDQIVTTSGGRPNQVTRTVYAVNVGDFALHYQLTVGSCPCANAPGDQLAPDGVPAGPAGAGAGASAAGTTPSSPAGPAGKPPDDTPASGGAGAKPYTFGKSDWKLSAGLSYGYGYSGGSYFTTGSKDDCVVTRSSCDELLKRAEEAEATARALRAAAEYARQQQQWNDREASAYAEAAEAARNQAAIYRRQANDYRALQQSATDRLNKNRQRARDYPQGGWEPWITDAEKDVARYAAEAEKLEAWARGEEARAQQADDLGERLRNAADDAERAAEEAEQLAQAARAAYLECLKKAQEVCTTVTTTVVDESPDEGGGAVEIPGVTAGGTGPGASSSSDDKNRPDLCGPDVSAAYTAALHRVFQRMKTIPASEKGAIAGTLFLKRNGWGIDQWPRVPPGLGCPSGACSSLQNEKGQACYRLFGHCVPAHVLNDTMFGFTAGLLGVPETIQNLGGNWAEGSFNGQGAEKAKYTPDLSGYWNAFWNAPDPELSRDCYRAGTALAKDWTAGEWTTGPDLGARLSEGWQGLLAEIVKDYPSIARCADCPDPAGISAWDRDWSRAPWTMGDGQIDYVEEARKKAGLPQRP